MREPVTDVLHRVEAAALDQGTLVRAVASGRRRGLPPPRWRRAELRPVELVDGPRLSITTYDATQAHTDNYDWGTPARSAVGKLLAEPFGNWHVERTDETLQVRIAKRGDAFVHVDRRRNERRTQHDRDKPRVVDPTAPYLHALGVTTAEGVVKRPKADKYAQVEQFVRLLLPFVDEVGDRAEIHVVDLGCGNAYLTFATYAALVKEGRRVRLLGVDTRESAQQHNTAVATRLGWQDDLTFTAERIDRVRLPARADGSPPDLVLSLHACDTATDDALAQAVRWDAGVVLASPCCQHDLHRRLAAHGSRPSALAPVLRHNTLRGRQSDLLTDAWRALVLRLLGYQVDVVEFVDSRHTPRNLLLRARRTGRPAPEELWRQHDDLVKEWGVKPYLCDVLAVELDAARAR